MRYAVRQSTKLVRISLCKPILLRPYHICGIKFVLKPALSAGDLEFRVCFILCHVGFISGNHFWIPVGDSIKKADLEEWFYAGSDALPWETVEAPLPSTRLQGARQSSLTRYQLFPRRNV